MDDYPAVYKLWQATEGVGLSMADEAPAIAAHLARNPGLSFVAASPGDAPVGTILGGHDGRRGYIHHLAVAPAYRRQGTGRALVARCLEGLEAEGIHKCHLFIYGENETGRAFWEALGWQLRHDIQIMSYKLI
jgi:ribosomal protein S18 acetylase RimI-like enzyme